MKQITRRSFLTTTAFAAGGISMLRRLSFAQTPDGASPFELLVVGDSLIYGQGLEVENKIYTQVVNWLERDLFGGKRAVNLKMKAHSGATLFLHEPEASALRKLGKTENTFFDSEIPVSFPSIATELETAKTEYSDPRQVDLILLSGGITDISVANILNIFGNARQFRAAVPKYCNDDLYALMKSAVESFPKARLGVIGYYPMVSRRSATHEVFNAVLEVYGFPRFTKPILNNLLTRPVLKMMRRKVINRSQFWAVHSALEQRKAIERLNTELGDRRAVFIPSPINDQNCVGTKNSLLFGMAKKGRADDPMYDRRRVACRNELAELVRNGEVDYSVRFCELAAIGHPNADGARAYANAIRTTLEPLIRGARTGFPQLR